MGAGDAVAFGEALGAGEAVACWGIIGARESVAAGVDAGMGVEVAGSSVV